MTTLGMHGTVLHAVMTSKHFYGQCISGYPWDTWHSTPCSDD